MLFISLIFGHIKLRHQKDLWRDLHIGSINSYPLLNQTWLTTLQVFKTFVLYSFTVKWMSDKNLHTQTCKLSYMYCLGVYPIYSRIQNFWKTPWFNLWHLVCLLWWFTCLTNLIVIVVLFVILPKNFNTCTLFLYIFF